MKILFATGIYPPDIGGPATYTRTMARALQERGHQVEVVCYAEDGGDGRRSTVEDEFVVSRISRSLLLPLRYLAFAWKVFCRARAMKADLVYLQGPGSEGFPGTIGAMFAGKPTVMKVVGDYAWEIYQGSGGTELLDEFITYRHTGKIGLLERIERWTAKRAKHVITPSIYLKRIVEKWGIESNKIPVIYNAIGSSIPGESREQVRAALELKEERILFYGGRAVPWKHIDFIIRLLPKLPDDIILFVGGDGPSMEFWKSEAKKFDVGHRVKFLGVLDQKRMGEMYRAADLFILPSGYEGYPNVVPEALSQGLSVFVSDKGGNPETQKIWDLFAEDINLDYRKMASVRVLEYLNEEVWLSALSEQWAERRDAVPGYAKFVQQMMIDGTEKLLKSCVS